MQAALKSVRDPKDSTDWALFGYEGKTFDLKVVSSGEDGIEEMVDDLSPSKILYGFIRVKDPRSTLPKYVFLHWQGEGCPVTLKGQASNLLRDVEKYVGSYQITITARNEDEVDVKEIMKQVEKASSSKFNFKTRKEIPKDKIPVTDVKSVYAKVIVGKDKALNMTERNKFWESEEAAKKETQKVGVSKNEIPTKQERETVWKARETEQKKNQTVVQTQSKSVVNEKKNQFISQNVGKSSVTPTENKKVSEPPSVSLKERMKMLEEAKATSNVQKEEVKSTNAPKTTPVPPLPSLPPLPSMPAASKPSKQVTSVSSYEEDDAEYDDEEQTHNIAYSEPEVDEDIYQNEPDEDFGYDIYENEPEMVSCSFDQGDTYDDDDSSPQQAEDLGTCAVTLYDYEAEDESEITFEPGEVITNIEKPDDNWWQGTNQQGEFGLFPANYVEEIDQSELEVS